jgi:hypothetical protein
MNINERYLFRGKCQKREHEKPIWVTGDLHHEWDGWKADEDGFDEDGSDAYLRTYIWDAITESQYEVSDAATIGQCTGVKDVNNNLIFEGDILRTYDGIKLVVEHDRNSANFIYRDEQNRDHSLYTFRNAVITGNIHDEK